MYMYIFRVGLIYSMYFDQYSVLSTTPQISLCQRMLGLNLGLLQRSNHSVRSHIYEKVLRTGESQRKGFV
jgi:hypothetical protein